MAEDTGEPEDVASLMRALWGPRANAPEDELTDLPEAGDKAPDEEPIRPTPAPTTSVPASATPAATAFDGFKTYLDAAFADQLASLRSYVDAALTEGIEHVRAEALAAVDARVSSALADQLASVGAEAAASAEARVAATEGRLLDRLDGLTTAVAEILEGNAAAATALARLEAHQQETAERLAALEQLAEPELLRLTHAVEDLQQASMAASNLAAARFEALEAADVRITASGRDLQAQLGALAASVDESTASAASNATDRMVAIEDQLKLELVRMSESVAAIRTELAASVSELETALGRWAAEWRADVDARLAGVLREIGPGPTDTGRRPKRRRVRRAEVERLIESVAGWRAQSVGLEELAALRQELGAEVERRFAVLDDPRAGNPPG